MGALGDTRHPRANSAAFSHSVQRERQKQTSSRYSPPRSAQRGQATRSPCPCRAGCPRCHRLRGPGTPPARCSAAPRTLGQTSHVLPPSLSPCSPRGRTNPGRSLGWPVVPGGAWAPLALPPAQEAAPGPAAPAASRGEVRLCLEGKSSPRPPQGPPAGTAGGARQMDGMAVPSPSAGPRGGSARVPVGTGTQLQQSRGSRSPCPPPQSLWSPSAGQQPPTPGAAGTRHVPKPRGRGHASAAGNGPRTRAVVPNTAVTGWPWPAPRHGPHHEPWGRGVTAPSVPSAAGWQGLGCFWGSQDTLGTAQGQ